MKKTVLFLVILGLVLMPLCAAGAPKADPLGPIYTAANYPVPTIVQGALTLSMPALEAQLSGKNQELAIIDDRLAAMTRTQLALGILGVLNLLGVVTALALIISRTKILSALGLASLADKPTGATSAGA